MKKANRSLHHQGIPLHYLMFGLYLERNKSSLLIQNKIRKSFTFAMLANKHLRNLIPLSFRAVRATQMGLQIWISKVGLNQLSHLLHTRFLLFMNFKSHLLAPWNLYSRVGTLILFSVYITFKKQKKGWVSWQKSLYGFILSAQLAAILCLKSNTFHLSSPYLFTHPDFFS